MDHLRGPINELTDKVADEMYLGREAPLERHLRAIIGTPDNCRNSKLEGNGYLVMYTANEGTVLTQLFYPNFATSSDCDISIYLVYEESAKVAQRAIIEARINPTAPPAARGGLDITIRDKKITKISYWTQNTKCGGDLEFNPDWGIRRAYDTLFGYCREEKVKRKQNYQRVINDLLVQEVLEQDGLTDN